MCAHACGKEFQVKHFGFHDCKPERFYQSQWTECRWVFWLFKFVLLGYWFSMFVASVVLAGEERHRWWIFLTHWGVITNLLYLLASFAVASYGVYHKPTSRSPPEIRTVSSRVSNFPASNTGGGEETGLRWFHAAVWILHSVAFDVALCITVLYWGILARNETYFPFTGINNHALNLVVMILDLFLNKIPVRVLHFYHASLLALVYIIFTLILHGANYTSSVYGVLNWAENPGLAAGLCAAVLFVAVPLSHAILFGLYHLRAYIARTCTPTVPEEPYEEKMKPVDNLAFEDE